MSRAVVSLASCSSATGANRKQPKSRVVQWRYQNPKSKSRESRPTRPSWWNIWAVPQAWQTVVFWKPPETECFDEGMVILGPKCEEKCKERSLHFTNWKQPCRTHRAFKLYLPAMPTVEWPSQPTRGQRCPWQKKRQKQHVGKTHIWPNRKWNHCISVVLMFHFPNFNIDGWYLFCLSCFVSCFINFKKDSIFPIHKYAQNYCFQIKLQETWGTCPKRTFQP